MAIRDTQDVLITEQHWTSGTLRVTQDVLLIEWQNTNAHLRVTQDVMIYEYPFVNAMFVYQVPGSTSLTLFTPIYAPVRKQPFELWGFEAARRDSITVDGVKRSALDRLDQVTTLNFDAVALSDMAAWKAFEQYALSGAQFAYKPLPDNPTIPANVGDNTAFSVCQLLSMDWIPRFESFQVFSLQMKLLLVRDL